MRQAERGQNGWSSSPPSSNDWRVIKPSYIAVWLSKPIEALDDDKPLDRIARGDYRAVAHLISSIEYPGAS